MRATYQGLAALVLMAAVGCSGTGPAVPTFDLPQFDTAAVDRLVQDARAEVDRLASTPIELPPEVAALLDEHDIRVPALPSNATEICQALGTPVVGTNWSSYPPHKHDDAGTEGEAELEEIYYFRIHGAEGFGLHRTYTADRSIDETVVVRDGDVFLVPRGYHGPCIAAPDFPMYYLNVLAGASDERSLGFSDDPAYAWIRKGWARR